MPYNPIINEGIVQGQVAPFVIFAIALGVFPLVLSLGQAAVKVGRTEFRRRQQAFLFFGAGLSFALGVCCLLRAIVNTSTDGVIFGMSDTLLAQVLGVLIATGLALHLGNSFSVVGVFWIWRKWYRGLTLEPHANTAQPNQGPLVGRIEWDLPPAGMRERRAPLGWNVYGTVPQSPRPGNRHEPLKVHLEPVARTMGFRQIDRWVAPNQGQNP